MKRVSEMTDSDFQYIVSLLRKLPDRQAVAILRAFGQTAECEGAFALWRIGRELSPKGRKL